MTWPRAFLFVVITLIDGMISLIGGLLWRMTLGWFAAYHPLSTMAYRWGCHINRWSFQPLGFRWESDSENINLSAQPGLKIGLFKHPPTLLTWAVAYLCGHYVSRRLAFVLKGSHIFNPMGWGLWGLGLAIFTTRIHKWKLWRSWPKLQQKLRRLSQWWYNYQVRRVMQRAKRTPGGIAIVILPDQRYSAERFKEYQREVGHLIPDLAEWDHQLPPRYIGTLQLLAATAGMDVPVVWINTTLQSDGEGWTNFAPYINGAARVRVREVTQELREIAPDGDISRFSEHPDRLRDWYNAFYRAEHQLDRAWRQQKRNAS